MLPIAFRLGPVAVYTYPLALFAAFACAWLLVRLRGPAAGVGQAAATDLALAAGLGGIIGARLWHAATFPSAYAAQWWRVFELQTGGLVFYGGVAGGALAVAAMARAERLSLPAVADLAALALPLASSVGRLGCLAAGCCGGAGLRPGAVTVPPQLLDAGAQLALFGVLLAVATRTPPGSGTLTLWWLALYGAVRFGIEYLRAEPAVALGLTQAQLVSAALVCAGVAGLLMTRRRGGAR